MDSSVRQRGWWFAATLAMGLVLMALLWSLGSERRAITKMPADERRALYVRQLESVKLMCSLPPVDDALKDRCRDQSTFLGQFPECDEGCRAVIDPILSHPTR